jgi:DNA replication factor GINS
MIVFRRSDGVVATIKYTHPLAVTMAQELDPMTFEDLSSAYRVEMKSQVLADARRDLYPALIKLQESLQRDYEAEYSKDPDSIMCEGMNERRKKVNNLVQKVIDLRMEKIVMMALRASMGANNVLDKLTQEERDYYNGIVEGSKKHRSLVLRDRSRRNYGIPDISSGNAVGKSADGPAVEVFPRSPVAGPADAAVVNNEGEEIIERPRKDDDERRETLVVIRILEDLPRIAGPDCDYDLKKEDIVRMPATLANALINHEKAVLLDVTP